MTAIDPRVANDREWIEACVTDLRDNLEQSHLSGSQLDARYSR
jgi:hypothetical protein